MTLLIGCLLISLALPYIAKIPLAYAMQQQGGYDNNHPRAQQAALTGFGARALAAHQNSFEAIIIFAPALLLAIAIKNTGEFIQLLAIIHVIARVLYNILYLINWGTLRSLVWFVALFCSFAIIWQSLMLSL